jgi:hypothetical protein
MKSVDYPPAPKLTLGPFGATSIRRCSSVLVRLLF